MEADEGLLVYRHGADPLTSSWWAGLDEDDRRQAHVEAGCYEELSVEERHNLWKVSAELSGEVYQ